MVSESILTVRYAETDQMGIVHHAVYATWYEVARTDFIKKLGLTYSEMEKMGVMTPLTDLSCHYGGVTKYEDVVTIRVKVTRLTPSRVEFSYELFKQGDTKPCNTGTTLHAWVNTGTFRPMNLKKHFPPLYASIQKAMEEETKEL